MTRRLIVKELQEHWLPFGAAVIIAAIGLFFVTLGSLMTAQDGSILNVLRSFLLTFGMPLALVFSNRLVVREYQGKTQLFLESLPLTRGRMVAVKYGLGLTIMSLFVAMSLLMLLPAAARRQVITARFVEIIALRAFAFTFLVYSFFFATGMLGRYRMAIYAGLALGLVLLTATTDIEVDRLGPFALMDHTFAFERNVIPLEHLRVTFGLGVVFTALAFALAIMREGSAAAMLAEKMSHREKMFITAMLLGILFLGSVFGKKPEKRPFDMPGAIVKYSPRAMVKIDPVRREDEPAADALATRISDEIAGVAEYLALARSPTVFVTTRSDLDANRYERGELVRGEGVLARVNLSAKGFDQDRFLIWLIREFLITATDSRVELESKRWVLDGFGPFWINRHRAEQESASLLSDRRLALRALYGTGGASATESTAIGETDLRNWLSLRERSGDGVAIGVAWSGLDVLARRQGAERTRDFLRAVLASSVPDDVRALWFEWQNGIATQMETIAGIRMPAFLDAWRDELDSARVALAVELSRLPRLGGELRLEPLSPDTRTARYRITLDPPGYQPARVTLLHANLPAFDTMVAPQELIREDIDAVHRATGELDGTWSRGERIYWTFSIEVADLGCDLVSGWNRQEIE